MALIGGLPVGGASERDPIAATVDEAQKSTGVSSHLKDAVAVPIPIANPTIGTGLLGVLLYVHPRRASDPESPRATTGAAIMYTDSDSALVGAFHDNAWRADSIRLTVGAGYGKFNLKYFGVGQSSADNALDYQIEGVMAAPELLFRLPGTEDWFFGAGIEFADSAISFPNALSGDQTDNLSGDFRLVGVTPVLYFDSRNDKYYPTSGIQLKARAVDFNARYGSDLDYAEMQSFVNSYHSVTDEHVLAWRFDLKRSGEATPFFALPYLNIRGVPRDRYRDLATFSAHAEWRWKFAARWGLVGFVDVGWHDRAIEDLFDGESIEGYGAGIRWRPSRQQTINLAVDFAISGSDEAVYVRVGEFF